MKNLNLQVLQYTNLLFCRSWLTAEILLAIILSIVFASFGVIPLHPKPIFLYSIYRPNISNSTSSRLERNSLTYMIWRRHDFLFFSLAALGNLLMRLRLREVGYQIFSQPRGLTQISFPATKQSTHLNHKHGLPESRWFEVRWRRSRINVSHKCGPQRTITQTRPRNHRPR